jgi:peptide/nickel transport system permease protein
MGRGVKPRPTSFIMIRYLVQRIFAFIPTLLGVSILIFLAIRLVPGDAIVAMLGTEAGMLTETQRESLEAYFGLDKPPLEQYVAWLGNAVRGNLGLSVRHGAPVIDVILSRFPVTLQLALMSLSIALVIGVPIGIVSAVRHNSIIDLLSRLLGLIGLATPAFLLGTLIIYVLSVYFRYLPNSGDYVRFSEAPLLNVQQMIFPAFTLGFPFAASVMRTTRSAMLEILNEDYIRTARSKGLRETNVLRRHALRNALIPVITLVGVELGYLLGGTVIVEEIFALPGIGRLVYNAISQRDYALVQWIVLFVAFNFILINLLVDVIYTLIDPRVTYAE